MGASTNAAQAQYFYDDQTLRLTERKVSRSQGIGPLIDDTSYKYDDAGNMISQTSPLDHCTTEHAKGSRMPIRSSAAAWPSSSAPAAPGWA